MDHPRYTLRESSAHDFPRLGEIMVAAFAEDAFALATLASADKDDVRAFTLAAITHWPTPPNHHIEVVHAVDIATGTTVGFAQWAVPSDAPHAGADTEDAGDVKFPAGGDAQTYGEYRAGVDQAEAELLGGRPHWSLCNLAIDPAFQRRGAGRVLTEWGIERAAEAGLSVYLNASAKGVPLYECLGFVLLKDELLTAARLPARHMIKESSSPGAMEP